MGNLGVGVYDTTRIIGSLQHRYPIYRKFCIKQRGWI